MTEDSTVPEDQPALVLNWTSNHHAYPHMAKAGWRWWEVDMTWWAIQTLKTLGLAKKVVMSPLHRMESY